MPAPTANQIHAAILVGGVLLTAYATGIFALALVPLIILLYVGVFYRTCPYRTEIVFACLFGSYLGLAYTGLWFLVWLATFGSASHKWFSRFVAAAFILLPFVPIAGVIIAGVPSWLSRSRGQAAAPRAGVNTGVIVVTVLLAPAWFFAAALAWHSWQSMSDMAEQPDAMDSR
jgi:hypothetical protein